MKHLRKTLHRQAGLSLMEVIGSLLMIGLVVSGALSLFSGADSSQKANQMSQDLSALRSAVKGLYSGNGGYGTVSLNTTLKLAKKIPSDLSVDASTPPVITHAMNGTIVVMGATSNFTITATSIPTDVCTSVLTNAGNGWQSIKVGATTVSTFPVDPATAAGATLCSSSATPTMVFTGS